MTAFGAGSDQHTDVAPGFHDDGQHQSHPNQFVWVRLMWPIVVKSRRDVRVLIRDVAESRHNAHFPNALCC